MQQKYQSRLPLWSSTRLALIALLVFAPLAQFAQPTANQPAYSIVQNGPHSRVWQGVTTTTNADGTLYSKTSSYTELATGLNHLIAGQWVESSETIQITPNGAAATNGQHQVYFPANINTAGGIHLVTPDGQDQRSQIVGLAYFDSATSNSVMIAEVQDSTGQLLPSQNQVLYTNAFTGNGLQADTRYSYTRAGLEQDVILRTGLPSPTNWNLNTQTTLLQVWTEFTVTPTPQIYSLTNSDDSPPDEWLNFGTMQMGPGKAFVLGDESELSPVFKQWQVIQGSTFLVESVPLDSVSSQLQNLPPSNPDDSNPGSSGSSSSGSHSMLHHLSNRTALLAQKRISKPGGPILIASKQSDAKGLVLDYFTINSTLTNFTFQSDTTYYVSSVVSSTGTNTFEGGTVIKFATNGLVGISSSTLNWNAGPYRPVVCTSQDDNSIGQPISVSTGNPTNYYYGYAMLELVRIPSPFTLNGLRMSYAQIGLLISSCQGSVYNAQFVNCMVGIDDSFASVLVANALFGNVQTNLWIQKDTTNNVENATFSGSSCLAKGPVAVLLCPLALTNCILANVTNLVAGSLTSTNGNYNSFYNCAEFGGNTLTNLSNPFQTVGAGNYYLVNNSTNRNVGTTNIDPTLLTDLQQKTTWPPQVISNNIFAPPLEYGPGANGYTYRDNGTNVDLGYHYDPIDFAYGNISILSIGGTNGSFILSPGAVITAYSTNNSNSSCGLTLDANTTFQTFGTANAHCGVVAFNTVQEQSVSTWTNPAGSMILVTGAAATNTYRFTEFASMAQDVTFISNSSGATVPIVLHDCEVHGGVLYSGDATFNLINCLMERVAVTNVSSDSNALYIRNCLFRGGSLNITFTNPSAVIRDNLFDGTLINDRGYTNYFGDYNAYIINSNYLTFTNSTDVFLSSSPAYQAGVLGNYYLPTSATSLIDKGSVTADTLGLYLYCTTTNQLAETNSTNDIGYHYAALNPIGVPNNDITNNLLLYYKLNEYIPITLPIVSPSATNFILPLADSSGFTGDSGAIGTATGYSNNPIIWRSNQTGFYSGAIHWRETVVDTGNSTRFNFGSNLFSINFWIQPLISSTTNIAIMGNGGLNFDAGWWIVFGDGTLQLGSNTGTNGTQVIGTASTAALQNEWTMLTLVRTTTDVSANNVSIYANGGTPLPLTTVLGYTMTFENPASSTNTLIFGQYNLDPLVYGTNAVLPLDGDFGVIRIYSNALNSNQINQLYTNGLIGLVR